MVSRASACWKRFASMRSAVCKSAARSRPLQQRHARYFLALAEQMGEALDTRQEREWLQRLEPERDNLRVVNGWALAQNEAEFAHRFNGALFAFWLYRSSATEARHWLEAVLALTAPVPTAAARRAEATALNVAGYLMIFHGNYALAQGYFERELALYTENGDQRGIATGLRGCAFTAMQSGDLARAQHDIEQSLVIARSAEDHWGVAWSLFDLGYLALIRNELSQAQALLEKAVLELHVQGIIFGLYRALFALAQVKGRRGDTVQARILYHDALRLQQQMHYLVPTADCLEGLAGIEVREGQPIRAAQLFGAANAHREETGMLRWQYQNAWFEHDLVLVCSQLDAKAWDAAWSAGRAMTLEQAVEYALAV